MDIILIGAQASGKGTQAELLRDILHLPHLSSGDLFRAEISQQTATGQQIQHYVENGALVPDDLTVGLVLQRLQQADCRRGVLLDGFPRTVAQAEALDTGLQTMGRQIDAVVYLYVEREVLFQRIAGRFICQAHQHIYNLHSNPPRVAGICDLDGSELYQRNDDRGDAVRTRLNAFFTQTIHLLAYYRTQQKIMRVNGNQPIEQVMKDIIKVLRVPALQTTR